MAIDVYAYTCMLVSPTLCTLLIQLTVLNSVDFFSVVNITGHYAGIEKITQNSPRLVGGIVTGAKDEKKEGIQIREFNR